MRLNCRNMCTLDICYRLIPPHGNIIVNPNIQGNLGDAQGLVEL